jgi:hypothetical protein
VFGKSGVDRDNGRDVECRGTTLGDWSCSCPCEPHKGYNKLAGQGIISELGDPIYFNQKNENTSSIKLQHAEPTAVQQCKLSGRTSVQGLALATNVIPHQTTCICLNGKLLKFN